MLFSTLPTAVFALLAALAAAGDRPAPPPEPYPRPPVYHHQLPVPIYRDAGLVLPLPAAPNSPEG